MVQILLKFLGPSHTKIEWFVVCDSPTAQKFIGICQQLIELSLKFVELPLFHGSRNSFKKIPDPDPDPGDLQHLTTTSFVRRYISAGKIFMQIRSVAFVGSC